MTLSWESYHEITNLLLSVHKHFNAGEFDDMGRIFEHTTLTTIYAWHDEALVAKGGPRIGDGYRRATRLYDGLPRVQYTLTNVMLDGDDATGQALSWSQYFALFGDESTWNQPHGMAPEQHDKPPIQIFCAGRYEDRFARVDGQWRFESRTCHADFTGDRSVHLAADPLQDRLNTELQAKR
ncbi:MAG TPA: nuclear transport factor 2 family protein [Acidimicrobiales bacterium]|jgi:hypothetical protein|nr:nuclear transport factor 2 family protein [Acidimicrobiales bacterium]